MVLVRKMDSVVPFVRVNLVRNFVKVMKVSRPHTSTKCKIYSELFFVVMRLLGLSQLTAKPSFINKNSGHAWKYIVALDVVHEEFCLEC